MQMRDLQNFVSHHFECFLNATLTDFRVSLQQIANSVRVLEITSTADEPVYRKVNFCNDLLAQLLYIGVRIGLGERLEQMFSKYQCLPPQATVKLGNVILNDPPYFSQTFLQHMLGTFIATAGNI